MKVHPDHDSLLRMLAEGEANISRQKVIIHTLMLDSRATERARITLELFENTQQRLIGYLAFLLSRCKASSHSCIT